MKYLRLGICALIVFAVLAYGAVEPWAHAVLETGAGLLGFGWALRAYFQKEQSVFVSPLLVPVAAFALLVLGQWVFRTTASRYETRIELQLLIAYCVVLFVAVQAFRAREEWRGFVWFLMVFGFLVAGFGILQHLTFNGKLYWTREMSYGGIPFGPFANRNHFAGFMELVIPVSLVPLAMGKVRRERLVLVGLFAFLSLGALLLSASRGGIISLGAELVTLALLMALRRVRGRHFLAGGGVVLLAVWLVSWLGARQILERFSSLQGLEVTVGKRASMRADTWRIFLDHPWIGSGLGTLWIVFPQYETLYDGKVVNHAHNDYLEALAESGLLGGLCCACFLGLLLVESLRRLTPQNHGFAATLHLSGLVACTGFLTHSLVDFNLHIPSNALLFFLLSSLATEDILT